MNMDSEDKRNCWIVAIVAVTLLSILTITALWNMANVKTFTEAGFTRKMLPGSTTSHWVKEAEQPKEQ